MAFPAWPSITVGQKLDSATIQAMQDWTDAVKPLSAVKIADQSVNNTNTGTTMVNATGLSLSLAANATYLIFAHIYCDGGVIADIKIAATVPSGATGYANCKGMTLASPDLFGGGFKGAFNSFTTAGGYALGGAGQITDYHYTATCTTTNAGTFQIQFAQNTADAANTTIRAVSNIYGWRVA